MRETVVAEFRADDTLIITLTLLGKVVYSEFFHPSQGNKYLKDSLDISTLEVGEQGRCKIIVKQNRFSEVETFFIKWDLRDEPFFTITKHTQKKREYKEYI